MDLPKKIHERVLYFEGALENLQQAQDEQKAAYRKLERADKLVAEKRRAAEAAITQIKQECDRAWRELPFVEKQRGAIPHWNIIKSSLISKIQRS